MQREKRPFNSAEIIQQLKKQSNKSIQLEKIFEAYENGVRQMNAEVRAVLRYGGRDIDPENEVSFNRSNSIVGNIDDLGEGKSRFERQDSNRQRWRSKAAELEQESNTRREENERILANLERIQEEEGQNKILLSEVSEEVQRLRKAEIEGKQTLEAAIEKQQKLQIIEANQVQDLKKLKEQLEKKIIEISEIENVRNEILEKYLLEKSSYALKMNEINLLQAEITTKMEKISEDEDYLRQRKITFQSEVNKTGVKVPETEHTSKISKVQQFQHEVPSKFSNNISKLHKNQIYNISQSLNSSIISTCGGDNSIKLYDPISQSVVGTILSPKEDTFFLHSTFSQNNDLLATALTDKTIQIYNYSEYKLISTLQGHTDKVNTVCFTSEKEKIVSGSADRTIKVWDLVKSTTTKNIASGSIVRSLQYFQNESHFVSGYNDGSIKLYSVRDSNQKPITQFSIFEGGVTSLKLSNCQNYLLGSSTDGFSVKCVDLRAGKVLRSFENDLYFNNHEFNKCCFGPDDQYVIAGCSDSTILIWNFQKGTQKSILKTNSHQGVIVTVEYDNITGNLYSGDSRGNLVVWNSDKD